MLLRRLLPSLLWAAALVAQDPAARIRLEADRRHQALCEEGYNLTWGFSLKAKDRSPVRAEILVPDSPGEEHRLSFWLEAASGEAEVRLLDPQGASVFRWSGRQGQMVLDRQLSPGKYALEIDGSRAAEGRAEFGVKGPLMRICSNPDADVSECPALPAKGFHWPYLLFLPRKILHPCLLVAPNNTGFASEDLALLRASAACDIQKHSPLAERLGCPLLVPLFPRPPQGGDNLYLHALTRESLRVSRDEWKRVDLQLLAMIDDARARLSGKGKALGPKVLLWGFSASGSFVNRFAMLHPERVLAVACGSPGGWPLAPVMELEGERLPYPVGIADLKTLVGTAPDWTALRAVPWFFFLGEKDANDAVPFRDSFSEADEACINRRFGTTLAGRWRQAEALYAGKGLDARFSLYPGAAHAVTPEMESDIARFFEARLAAIPPADHGRLAR